MRFTHDIEVALLEAAELVNTLDSDQDDLTTIADLDRFLVDHPYTGRRLGSRAELELVRALRSRLRQFWSVDGTGRAVDLVNRILADTSARPYLTRHDGWDWHLHVTEPDAPLADRIGAEAAMAVADLIRADELDRLQVCSADDCTAVLVDLSKNRSKRYCDTTCGNRANVAAYRARKRTVAS